MNNRTRPMIPTLAPDALNALTAKLAAERRMLAICEATPSLGPDGLDARFCRVEIARLEALIAQRGGRS